VPVPWQAIWELVEHSEEVKELFGTPVRAVRAVTLVGEEGEGWRR
jgi:hypothetical protein